MGWAFVKRRMKAELGADWQAKVRELRASARPRPPRSARCIARARTTARRSPASCNIPTCSRRSRPTCSQLGLAVRHPPPHGSGDRHHRDRQGDRRAHARGARLRARGQARRALSRHAGRRRPQVRVPRVWPELSTGRLLTLDWLEGTQLLDHKDDALAVRNRLAHRDVHRLVVPVQPLRRDPRRSASRQLHGVRARTASRAGINLLDYGCIRIFPPSFVGGVVDLYNGLLHGDDDAASCTPTRPGASSGSRAS